MIHRQWIFWALLIVATCTLRLWDLPDLLHYELDQARDTFVVYDALSSGTLPLEGPIARGSDLRLGPIFYYFQIFSGMLFGVYPFSAALPDILWGIGAIPLIYLLARRFVGRDVAYAVTALATTSLFLITYSRFAWNPNSMVFWSLASVLLALSATRSDHSPRRRLTALFGWGISVGVLIQLHFIAFLTLPLIYGAHWALSALQARTIWWRGVFVGLCGILLATTPLIISEVRSHGTMTQSLIATIGDKGTQDATHSSFEKLIRAGQETATYFTVSLISEQWGGDSVRTGMEGGLYFICDDHCKDHFPFLLIEIFLFVSAVSLFLSHLYRAQTSGDMHIAAWRLVALWGVGAGVFLILVAYQISPRFYLFLMPFFIVLWSILLEWIYLRIPRPLFMLLIGTLCAFNIMMFSVDLHAQKNSQSQVIDVPRDIIMERSDRVTYGALREIAQDAAHDITTSADASQPLLLVGDNRYARALYFIIATQHPEVPLRCYVKRSDYEPNLHDGYNAILLTRTRSKKQVPDHRTSDMTDTYRSGTLTLYHLTPPQRALPHRDSTPTSCHTR